MAKKYQLKKKAREFFDDKLSAERKTLEAWNDRNIPIELLDECPRVRVDFGHSKGTLTSLSGYDYSKKEAEFLFTIKVERIPRRL